MRSSPWRGTTSGTFGVDCSLCYQLIICLQQYIDGTQQHRLLVYSRAQPECSSSNARSQLFQQHCTRPNELM